MPTLPGAVSTPPGAKDIPDLFPDSPKSVPFAADSKSQVEPAKTPEAIDPFDPDIFHGKVAPKK